MKTIPELDFNLIYKNFIGEPLTEEEQAKVQEMRDFHDYAKPQIDALFERYHGEKKA